MSPRYVERRVVVLAGYHVITISLGEVNKRFCQSTAVMQSVEGDCMDLFFYTDLHAGRDSRRDQRTWWRIGSVGRNLNRDACACV